MKEFVKIKDLLKQSDLIYKSMKVSKQLPAGTRRQWSTGTFEKQPDGSWAKVADPGQKPAEKPDVSPEKPSEIKIDPPGDSENYYDTITGEAMTWDEVVNTMRENPVATDPDEPILYDDEGTSWSSRELANMIGIELETP